MWHQWRHWHEQGQPGTFPASTLPPLKLPEDLQATLDAMTGPCAKRRDAIWKMVPAKFS